MLSKESIDTLVENYISSVEFPAAPEKLYAPIKYSLRGGGKRLRPAIVAMAYNIFADDVQRVLPCAAAVEMFHTFTLLHDDIMDNADVRRGMPTVHRKSDHNTALLSGDAMMICSYGLLEKMPATLLPAILHEFNRLAIEVCEGQQYDMDFEAQEDVTLDEYMEMIRLKTAALFAGAARIGALAGGASDADADALYRFGQQLGFAYQLQDDYLDIYGTEQMLGKKIGGDVAENKKTFLLISALREAGDATRRAMMATLRDTSHSLDQRIGRIRTIYDSLDIPEVTLAAIGSHLDKAGAAIESLSVAAVTDKTAPLKNLLAALRNRNK